MHNAHFVDQTAITHLNHRPKREYSESIRYFNTPDLGSHNLKNQKY